MKMTEEQRAQMLGQIEHFKCRAIGLYVGHIIESAWMAALKSVPEPKAEPAPDKGDIFCDTWKVLVESLDRAIAKFHKAFASAVEKRIQAAKPDPSPFPVSLSQAILYDFDGVAVPGIISGGRCIFSPKINTAPATPGKFKPFDEDKMFRPFQS